ncbi:MAG: GPI anchored serine-threonine rich family protein [Acidobacteria bacterium]|nr:GPI anchored serine-threonine rich family protein [Acidobacteriota bacterium]
MKNQKAWVSVLGLFFLAGLAWGQSIHFTASAPTSGANARWCKGNTYTISWTSEGHNEPILIDLHRSGGVVLVIGSNLPSNGSLNWIVPGSLASADGYYLNFRTMAGHYGFATGPFRIDSCLQQTTPQLKINPNLELSREQPPVQAMVFEQFEQGAIQLDPASLTIRWGTHSIQVGRNETKTISIDEDSDLIDPTTHGLRATVAFTLRNTMPKNFRFHVALRYGGHFYAPLEVMFVGIGSKSFTQDLVLYPGNQTLPLSLEATDILIDGGSNDVRPNYFNASLRVHIYPN